MSTPERQRKVEKIIEAIMEQLSNEPMIFDERFTGKLSITFNVQSGGISADVEALRKGRLVTV